MLAQLAASGVQMPSQWKQETAASHMTLALQHLRRAVIVACTWRRAARRPPLRKRTVSRLSRRSQSSRLITATQGEAGQAAGSEAEDEIEMNEEGVPDVDQLAARGLIMPVGTWKEKWDLLVLLLIVYSAVVAPVRVCFGSEASGLFWWMELGMTLCFLLDMAFSFNTIYFESAGGRWVISRVEIAQTYLRGWFWIDAPGSVPVELIDLAFDGSQEELSLLRFLRMFRLLRLLRLLKIDEYAAIAFLHRAIHTALFSPLRSPPLHSHRSVHTAPCPPLPSFRPWPFAGMSRPSRTALR